MRLFAKGYDGVRELRPLIEAGTSTHLDVYEMDGEDDYFDGLEDCFDWPLTIFDGAVRQYTEEEWAKLEEDAPEREFDREDWSFWDGTWRQATAADLVAMGLIR
jgi:hypothetical protein